jgi:hypothetical protein
MFPVKNIDALIRRAVTMKLIRLDSEDLLDTNVGYAPLLQGTSELLERIQHGATMRRIMYDYAELCRVPVGKQIESHSVNEPNTLAPSRHSASQLGGLKKLEEASKSLVPEKEDGIHNPNVLVNCDSGRDGELGCEEGWIKVYQGVFQASYGAGGYKDVCQNDLGKVIIHPAQGGKCNVSIGNPFRSIGWFFNYASQGSKAPLIRMWEIPQAYFEEMLKHCGTELQISKQKKKDPFYVEMCDHKATNQFGLWTHEANGTPTAFGTELMSKSRNLVTYYDPKGTHKPDKRDGECRSIKRLLTHLAIPTDVTDRFHDLGTALSDAKGNLTMNALMAESDGKLLALLDLLELPEVNAAPKLETLDKQQVRLFCNLLTYNDLNPQKLNKVKYTSTGLSIANLGIETQFMLKVHQSRKWHFAARLVLGLIKDSLPTKDRELPKDCQDELKGFAKGIKTYKNLTNALLANVSPGGDLLKSNSAFIDAFNVMLRPLCSNGNLLKLQPVKVEKTDTFRFEPLKKHKFAIGASQRADSSALRGPVDSLDGNTLPGFVRTTAFDQPLGASIHTSNDRFQLFQHDPVIAKLHESEIPVMGGISGTTRDIFRYFGQELAPSAFWNFFSVVAAFMIKHHYHSLGECFAAAQQFYTGAGGTRPSNTHDPKSTALYKHIRLLTGVPFV